jgi:hypothetical protein
MMNTTRLFLLSSLIAAGAVAGCSSSDNGCGDAGCLDASFNGDVSTGPAYTPVNGKYKITAYVKGSQNDCNFDFSAAVNSTDQLDWFPVSYDGTTLKIGNPKGTPAAASFGEGPIIGSTAMLSRSNHVTDEAPATCNYDEMIMSTATLDDPSTKSIGLSVKDTRANRTACDAMPTVKTCTSTWSFRLTPAQ